MADVFISYSRKDRPFVEKLHKALAPQGLDIWVDWEDIPPTAEWLAEIHAAIEAADSFVFVISPDSVKSPVCRQEIEHAAKHNKRLVPIVCADVTAAAVPDALARLNWIFFRHTDDFDAALKTLLQALKTDLARVRMHTRLTVRAVEWTNKQHNASFLLRGKDLQEAEQWLIRSAGKDPQPTPLHVEYITLSRAAETRRKRITLAIVAIGSVVAMLLALIAISQTQVAQTESTGRATQQARADTESLQRATVEAQRREQEQIANQQVNAARRARSNQLAERSLAVLDRSPQQALLLAAEAFSLTNSLNETPTLAAENAMLQALAGASGRGLGEQSGPITDLAISTDGRWAAVASKDGTARVWELSAAGVFTAPLVLRGHTDAVKALDISPDSRWLATAGEDETVRFWNLTASDPNDDVTILRGHERPVSVVAFSPDGRWLVSGDMPGRGEGQHAFWREPLAQVWDLNATPVITRATLRGHTWDILAAAFSPDGHWLATSSTDSTVDVWNTDALDLTDAPTTLSGHRASALAVSPDSTRLLTADDFKSNDIYVWDLKKPETPLILSGHQAPVNAIAISPNGRWLVSGSRDTTARVWDLTNPITATRILTGHASPLTAVAISSNSKYLGTADESGVVRLWDMTNLETAPVVLRGHAAAIVTLAFTPDSRQLLSGSADGTARAWDTREPKSAAATVIRFPSQGIGTAALSPDGRWLVTGVDRLGIPGNTGAWLWDLQNRLAGPRELRGFESFPLWRAIFSPDGRWLATAGDTGPLYLWDMADSEPGAEPRILPGHEKDGAWEIVFSPDSRWLATGSYDSTARLWDLSDLSQEPRVVQTHQAPIFAVAISPDSHWLATGSGDGDIRLSDITKPAADSIALHHPATVSQGGLVSLAVDDLEFSPNGRWLAAGTKDTHVYVWDMNDPKIEAAVVPWSTEVDSVAFSPDNRWLAASGWLNNLLIDVNTLLAVPVSMTSKATAQTVVSLTLPVQGREAPIAFSPDGHWLVANGNRLWDMTASDPSAAFIDLPQPDAELSAISFSGDGRWLLTLGSDRAARIWDLRWANMIERACQAAGRNLNPLEWQQDFPGQEYRKTCAE